MNVERRIGSAIILLGEDVEGATVVVPDAEVRGVTFDALGEDEEHGPYLTADGERWYIGRENAILASAAMEQAVITLVQMPATGPYEQYLIRADAPAPGMGAP